MSASDSPLNAVAVAKQLAQGLHAQNREYALGGAIALGYWGSPRGTVDVDVTIFLPPDCSDDCIWLLQEIGCEFSQTEAIDSFAANGFCRVAFAGLNVDVFLPIVPFYETARKRRKEVNLGGQMVAVWDAESLAVFKMMFFRRKDLADVEQILRTQGVNFDRSWVCEQLVDIYGARDPRISAWDELVREVPAK